MRVLISGAGVAGPTLAYFLQESGADVTVLEKASSLLAHGQNIDIQGSGEPHCFLLHFTTGPYW